MNTLSWITSRIIILTLNCILDERLSRFWLPHFKDFLLYLYFFSFDFVLYFINFLMRLWPRMFPSLSIVCVKDVEIFKRDWKLHVSSSSILFLPYSLASGVKKLQPVTILLCHPLLLGWSRSRIVEKTPKYCMAMHDPTKPLQNLLPFIPTIPILIHAHHFPIFHTD